MDNRVRCLGRWAAESTIAVRESGPRPTGPRSCNWPPPTELVRRRAEDRFYVARREWPAIYVLLADDAARIATASSDRLEWGPGRDARALAGALLLDLCRVGAPERVIDALAGELLSRLPAEGFVIEADELLRWVLPRHNPPAWRKERCG